MYGSRAVTLLVLISDDAINRIPKPYIQTNILVCKHNLTSKVHKERNSGQSYVVVYSGFHLDVIQTQAITA